MIYPNNPYKQYNINPWITGITAEIESILSNEKPTTAMCNNLSSLFIILDHIKNDSDILTLEELEDTETNENNTSPEKENVKGYTGDYSYFLNLVIAKGKDRSLLALAEYYDTLLYKNPNQYQKIIEVLKGMK